MATRRMIMAGLGSIGRRHTRLLNARDGVDLQASEPEPAALHLATREMGPMRG
jgi:hypothetical protein